MGFRYKDAQIAHREDLYEKMPISYQLLYLLGVFSPKSIRSFEENGNARRYTVFISRWRFKNIIKYTEVMPSNVVRTIYHGSCSILM